MAVVVMQPIKRVDAGSGSPTARKEFLGVLAMWLAVPGNCELLICAILGIKPTRQGDVACFQ